MTDPTPTVRTNDDVRSWVLALLRPENAPVLDVMTARELAWQVVDLTTPERLTFLDDQRSVAPCGTCGATGVAP